MTTEDRNELALACGIVAVIWVAVMTADAFGWSIFVPW